MDHQCYEACRDDWAFSRFSVIASTCILLFISCAFSFYFGDSTNLAFGDQDKIRLDIVFDSIQINNKHEPDVYN